jgi:hypothetical protein
MTVSCSWFSAFILSAFILSAFIVSAFVVSAWAASASRLMANVQVLKRHVRASKELPVTERLPP